MQKVIAILKENGTFFTATVEDGKPKVRPCSFFMVYEGKLYIGTGTHKATYRQLTANPYFEICSCKGQRWVRISGRTVEDNRPEVQEAMFREAPYLRKFYNEENGHVHSTFRVEDGVAEIMDMMGNFERIEL